ncbi:hypothetical protein [Clostridium estertheticum]|uniref:Uncharacterized protein n=1 Tax=Clostridium estertheticum TaxID=238834 RepID=A0AA47EMH8_9CLOT|nr:hypothetical protein [Clostridium estertheticum]MBU3157843.1 hypothetical protein [Clostridium estertheticum]WAG62591.1 hypothetical protein LL038_10275 [Clostridium estertheticum]
MDTVKVRFYLDGGMETICKHYNTAEINAIFLSGKVCIEKKTYKISFSSFNADENELGIDII